MFNASWILLTDVFNTEAHPFEAPPPLDNYGTSGSLTTPRSPPEFTPTQAPLPGYSQSHGLPQIPHIHDGIQSVLDHLLI